MAEPAPETTSAFTFHVLEKSAFKSLSSREAQDSLHKWSKPPRAAHVQSTASLAPYNSGWLQHSHILRACCADLGPFMRTHTFRFDQRFDEEQLDVFLADFFGDATVQAAMPVSTAPDSWAPLGPVKQGAVRHTPLRTTVLRLDFFDRLNDAKVVRNGSIGKCLDQPCGDILISNLLQKLLLDEESEEWELFSEADRSELIFHVMRRLAIGGGMCQVRRRQNQRRPSHDAHAHTLVVCACSTMTRWSPIWR